MHRIHRIHRMKDGMTRPLPAGSGTRDGAAERVSRCDDVGRVALFRR